MNVSCLRRKKKKNQLHHSHWELVRFNYGEDVKVGQRASACIWHKKKGGFQSDSPDSPHTETPHGSLRGTSLACFHSALRRRPRLSVGGASVNQPFGVPSPMGARWRTKQGYGTEEAKKAKSCNRVKETLNSLMCCLTSDKVWKF